MKCYSEGKHKGHNTFSLGDSKQFIKTNLEKSIEIIEHDLVVVKNIPEKVTKEMDENQSKKDQAKSSIKQQFEELKEMIKEKELNLLSAIENIQLENNDIIQLISDSKKIIDDFPPIITTGKAILDNWNTTEITADTTDKIISIINKSKEIRKVKNKYNEVCGFKTFIILDDFKKEIQNLTKSISRLEIGESKKVSILGPSGLMAEDVGIFSVALKWDKNMHCKDNEYIVSIQDAAGGKQKFDKEIRCSDNKLLINSLNGNTVYNIRVRAERELSMSSEWSDVISVKTLASTLKNLVDTLSSHCNDASICLKTLNKLNNLTGYGKYYLTHYIDNRHML